MSTVNLLLVFPILKLFIGVILKETFASTEVHHVFSDILVPLVTFRSSDVML